MRQPETPMHRATRLAKKKLYHEEHREEINAKARATRAADLPSAREREHAWEVTHRVARQTQRRARRAAYPEEARARDRAYYLTHPAHVCAKKQKYNETHWEENRAYSLAYDAAHRAERCRKALERFAADPERFREGRRAYRAAHLEEIRAKGRAWGAAHPELISEKNKRRRVRKAHAPVNDFTAAQWKEMKEAYGHRCVYCGKKFQRLTQDHITPLSQGGSHTLANIVPACHSCNSRKNARAPLCAVQPLLLTVA